MSHTVRFTLIIICSFQCMSIVLRPLNVKARLILAMKPRQENFQRPMFDIKVDLDEISLNINREQVNLLH